MCLHLFMSVTIGDNCLQVILNTMGFLLLVVDSFLSQRTQFIQVWNYINENKNGKIWLHILGLSMKLFTVMGYNGKTATFKILPYIIVSTTLAIQLNSSFQVVNVQCHYLFHSSSFKTYHIHNNSQFLNLPYKLVSLGLYQCQFSQRHLWLFFLKMEHAPICRENLQAN